MFVKIIFLTRLLVISMPFNVNEDIPEGNSVATKIISKLIAESGRLTVHFVNSNSEILSHIAQLNDLNVAVVTLNDFGNISISEQRKIEVTILHLESLSESHRFFNVIGQVEFLYDGYFVIFCDKTNDTEMGEIFSQFWKIFIYNVNVLVPSDDSYNLVSMFTYLPFADGSCNSTDSVLINQFDRSSSNWTTNVFFPKKFQQLNRCPIRFGAFHHYPRFMVNTENGVKTITGVTVDVANAFGNILNYTAKFIQFGHSALVYKGVIDNEADLMITSISRNNTVAMSITRTLYFDSLVIVVPPPFLLGSIEKLLLPFSSTSWASIGVAVLSACGIIMLSHFIPKAFHDCVIGSRVKGSLLNVWNVFLGGPVSTVPQKTFPRFLLVTFLIFSLIVRSLYQGQLFDILNRDVRTVQLKTIADYIGHQFTFYIYPSLLGSVGKMQFLNSSRYDLYNDTDILSYYFKTLNAAFKGVVVSYERPIMYHNLMNRKNFTFRTAKEVLKSGPFALSFTKNFYMYNEIDHLLYRFDSAGLLDKIMLKYIDPNLLNDIDKQPPTALDYSHTQGIFELFYCGCALALLTFFCEIVFGRNKSMSETGLSLQRMFHFKR